MKLFNLAIVLAVTLVFSVVHGEQSLSETGIVDTDGDIRFPENYQTELAHIGSWFVPAKKGNGLHQVYMQAESIAAFNRTGSFPDGTIIVKEVVGTQSGIYTTGADVSYSSNDVQTWFVMIKDSKNSFPENKLWGNGWGWAQFSPETKEQTATDFKVDCLHCHVPVTDKDYIYTEGYPILKQ